MNKYFIYYILFINILAFIIMGIDKLLAIKHKRRISEFCLLSFSFFGGSLGEIFGMLIFHHKTKHFKFIALNPIFFIIWMIILIKIKN